MKILKKLKRTIACASVIGCIVFVSVPSAFSQIVKERPVWRQDFISRDYRPRWGEEYENFGDHDFRRYPRVKYNYVWEQFDKQAQGILRAQTSNIPVRRGPVTPVSYDQFGNFALPGGEIYSMSWNKSRIGASETADLNWMDTIFNNLVIMSDDFSNWQTKFMISRATEYNDGDGRVMPNGGIRAYFTPSTLKITNFNGIRWDASSRKNNVTFIASSGQIGDAGKPMYGVHWQSVLGDVLKLGATYVHKQRGTIADSHQDLDERIKSEPRYIYVVVTDDSPADTGPGARVYDIKAVINGQVTPIAFHGENYPVKGRILKIPDILNSRIYTSSFSDNRFIFQLDSESQNPSIEEQRNAYGSWFLNLLDKKNVDDPSDPTKFGINNELSRIFSKTTTGELGLVNIAMEDVTGNADDRWDPSVPGQTQKLRYYQADTSRGYVEAQGSDVIIYELLVPQNTRDLAFNIQASNDYCIDIIAALYRREQFIEADWNDNTSSQWTIHYDMKQAAKASGNVKDSSNMQWVKVRYDRLTGMNVYGMNLEFDWRGLFVRAEYNVNNTFWSYPTAAHVDDGSTHTQTERAWFVNVEKEFEKVSVGGEFFNYPFDYMNYWPTIEDNDDDDRWVGMYLNGAKRAEYPGLDADYDRYIDTTWQGEPFIDYFYDSITMGDDFNHNGYIDSREDDVEIDLPYQRDSRGQHYFFKMRPTDNTLITLGHYDIKQETYEGRNFTRYLKIEHYQSIADIGEFLFYSRTERVKDDFKLPIFSGSVDKDNDGYNFLEYLYSAQYGHDYINNWQTTNYLQSRVTVIPNTNIINNFKFNTSYELGDLFRSQDKSPNELVLERLKAYNGDELIERYGSFNYSLEHKVDYTLRIADARLIPEVSLAGYRLWKEKRIRELKFMPMVKFVHSYTHYQKSNYYMYEYDRNNRQIDFYPIVRLDYRVAPKTLFRLGIQGFPGLPQVHREKSLKLLDYDERNMVMAFENQTLYQGFNLVVLMGIRFTEREYVNDAARQDPGSTQYFVTLQSEAGG